MCPGAFAAASRMQQRRLQTCWSIGGREQQLRDARLMSVPVIAHFEPVTTTSNQLQARARFYRQTPPQLAKQWQPYNHHTRPSGASAAPHRGLCSAPRLLRRGSAAASIYSQSHCHIVTDTCHCTASKRMVLSMAVTRDLKPFTGVSPFQNLTISDIPRELKGYQILTFRIFG